MDSTKEKIAMRIAWNTIAGNVLLSAFKLLAGVFGHSAAMISDSVHSLSDVLSTGIVMIGIKMAAKAEDADHPYGHERLESVAAIILAAILCVTGLGIGYSGLRTILAGNYAHLTVPGLLALVAALVSILTKEAMFWYTRTAARQISSDALLADAWHHRSDALSSIGSLAGIAGARLGFPVLDSVASLIICLFIVKTAYAIFREAIGKLTDRSPDAELLGQIRRAVLDQREVQGIDLLRSRIFGDKVYLDLEISVDGSMSLSQAHAVAHAVHDQVETAFPQIKHCMVHVNPAEAEKSQV